jgi:L-asparaginase
VALYTLGGTIAMRQPRHGAAVVPGLAAKDLVEAVPQLADAGVELEQHDLRSVPGASVGIGDVLELAAEVARRAGSGVDGVVVTQGTDTIEETSYLIDLVHGGPAPIVVTGAMRNPSMAGADGPANLLAAVQVAADPRAAGLGCVVVMNDEVHAARWVRKTHTASTAAFRSPAFGPLGRVTEGRLEVYARPDRRTLPGFRVVREVRVAVVTVALDDDGALLRACGDGFDGVVLAGFGVGHIPQRMVPVAEELAARVPVVLASRIGVGPVLATTYGFVGSESDLLARGLIPAGPLDPYKARVLLHLLLAAGTPGADVPARFRQLSAP